MIGSVWGIIVCTMVQLRYFDEYNALQVRTLGEEKFVIGRVESCQIIIVDDLVSREHARFDRDPDGRYRVRDLGSRNKTYVNGEQISETLLSHGDVVRVGNRVFEFLDDAATDEALDLSFMTPDRSDPVGTEWVKIKVPVTLSLERVGHLAVLGSDAHYPARAEDVASAALSRLLLELRADRGFVALRGEHKKDLRPVAYRGLGHATGTSLTPVSQTFAFAALLQSVAGRYPQNAGQMDGKAGYAATAMVAPLLHQNRVVGVVYIDRPSSNQPFTATMLQEMSAAGAHIGALMAETSKRLSEGQATGDAQWLATLRRMQMAMTIPPQRNETFDVAVKLLAGHGRCGDFCDVIHLDDKRSVVLVTDAGGQGILGVAQANGIRTAVRAGLTMEGLAPGIEHLMSAINRSFTARQGRQLVTCTLLSIDIGKGQITYVNAGGPPPLLLAGAKRLVTLDQPSLMLGIDTNYGYEASVVDLPADFRLICHTDGLLEATNGTGEAFGAQRLHDLLLHDDAFEGPSAIIDRIVKACDQHRSGKAYDDDALIAVISRG